VVSAGWRADDEDDDRRAALRLLVDFRTWQVLTGAGLDDARAAVLAARMAECGCGDGDRRVRSTRARSRS